MSPAADHAAADDDDLRVEDVHDVRDPDTESRADQRHHLARRGIAVVRQLGHERAGDLAPAGGGAT